MSSPIKDFKQQRRVALEAGYNEVTSRLEGFLDWMKSIRVIAGILKSLDAMTDTFWEKENEANKYAFTRPPQARGLEQVARVGLESIRRAQLSESHLYDVARYFEIRGKGHNGWSDESRSDAIVSRYIVPLLDWVEQRLPIVEERQRTSNGLSTIPPIIHGSLKRFHAAHRNAGSTCFIMMRFGKTKVHSKIETTIKAALKKHGLVGVLARDREFHDDLFPNILTYVHGCAFGVAVFERLETDEFNPNVALEVGYMLGLRKQVLLLKDQTLRALHTDLVGKLYREFDPQSPQKTIPNQIESWLSDKGLA